MPSHCGVGVGMARVDEAKGKRLVQDGAGKWFEACDVEERQGEISTGPIRAG